MPVGAGSALLGNQSADPAFRPTLSPATTQVDARPQGTITPTGTVHKPIRQDTPKAQLQMPKPFHPQATHLFCGNLDVKAISAITYPGAFASSVIWFIAGTRSILTRRSVHGNSDGFGGILNRPADDHGCESSRGFSAFQPTGFGAKPVARHDTDRRHAAGSGEVWNVPTGANRMIESMTVTAPVVAAAALTTAPALPQHPRPSSAVATNGHQHATRLIAAPTCAIGHSQLSARRSQPPCASQPRHRDRWASRPTCRVAVTWTLSRSLRHAPCRPDIERAERGLDCATAHNDSRHSSPNPGRVHHCRTQHDHAISASDRIATTTTLTVLTVTGWSTSTVACPAHQYRSAQVSDSRVAVR